jgi:hypothetical protein
LVSHGDAANFQLVSKAMLVDRLKQTRAERTMDLKPGIDDFSCEPL